MADAPIDLRPCDRPPGAIGNAKSGSCYTSDLFAMIGTLFLWLFWPSFNAALTSGTAQERTVINTYLSISASALTVYIFSRALRRHGKFEMVEIQNATLAGGVAMGASGSFMLYPWGALLVGMVAGALSTVGFIYITPFLEARISLHDTAGINNLHGMPGILGGIVSAVAAALAPQSTYGESYARAVARRRDRRPVALTLFAHLRTRSTWIVFPARAPSSPTNPQLLFYQSLGVPVTAGDSRSAVEQGGYQIAALTVTIAIAISGGLVTGWLLRNPFFEPTRDLYEDSEYWHLPVDAASTEAVHQARPAANRSESTASITDQSAIPDAVGGQYAVEMQPIGTAAGASKS